MLAWVAEGVKITMQENENMSHEHDNDENHDAAHEDNDVAAHAPEHNGDHLRCFLDGNSLIPNGRYLF